VFFKTYFEKRSTAHMLVNFNRIWILHISAWWFFTAYNSPRLYAPFTEPKPSAAMTWSATALGGAVATLIMILATLAEFAYIPTTWNNASHLTTRLLFLLIVLAVTGGPTVYIVLVDGKTSSNIPTIVSIVQFGLALAAFIAFAIIPSGRMFGDRVAGKSRKYMASQTFTASYPELTRSARSASIGLWVLIFGCKFTESYFFLTTSFSAPVAVMARNLVLTCVDPVFGTALCSHQVEFTLAIMYVMDLIMFFLDTYLWYIIWSVIFSVSRSFHMGLSIWTPWKEVYTRLPKRIYAKLLATGEMEVKYKPKVREHIVVVATHFHAFARFSCPKFGTPLSLLCIASIFCPSTTCSSCFTSRHPAPAASEDSVLHHSSPTTPATRPSSSRSAAKLNVAFHTLLSHLRRLCPILCLWTLCQRSLSWFLTTPRRFCLAFAKSSRRRIKVHALPCSNT
jgi:hypothetical protein